jgi:hypothetical protein
MLRSLLIIALWLCSIPAPALAHFACNLEGSTLRVYSNWTSFQIRGLVIAAKSHR